MNMPDNKSGPRFADLFDIPGLQRLMDRLYEAAGIPVGIITPDGQILVGTGWQEICTKFHRINPETARLCGESDRYIGEHMAEGEFVEYKCRNHLWDMGIPIVIAGAHVADLFVGQFFYDDEERSEELFRARAREYGFDEEGYLSALAKVPVFTRERILTIQQFYREFVRMLEAEGTAVHELTRSRAQLAERVEERTEKLRRTVIELERTSNSLEKSRQEAERANQAKDRFVGFIAHDFKSPLASWIGLTDLLAREEGLSCELREQAAAMAESQRRTYDLIGQVLNLNRLAGGAILHPSGIDAQMLTRVVVDEHRPMAARKGVGLTALVEPGASLWGDLPLLIGVTGNLVSNALKFTPQGGDVTLTAGGNRIAVADTGIGIDATRLAHLFEPGHHPPVRGTSGEQGHGMGLAFCQEVVRLHGGRIEIESEPGKGSTFTLHLPPHRPADAGERYAPRPATARRETNSPAR